MKRLADYLDNSNIIKVWIKINQSVTLLSLVVASGALYVAYSKYTEDRIKSSEDRISKAWDTVIKMAGKNSNGGQINAIQVLVSSGVSLDKIDLRNTYLAGANLKDASLRAANLSGANLIGANLQNADLSGANVERALLYNSNLGGTRFGEANFSYSRLAFAKIDIGLILAKSLINADLTGVTFVLQDIEGNSDFSTFGDTIAESPRADERQKIIDQACASISFAVFILFIFNERETLYRVFAVAVALMVVLTHQKNINRILKGTESKVPILRHRDRRKFRRKNS